MSISEMACFTKACINAPIKFVHFSSDTFSTAGILSLSFEPILALSAVLCSTVSAILLSNELFVVMHFQILLVQSVRKLQLFQRKCERLKNFPHNWICHYLNFVPAIYCVMHLPKLSPTLLTMLTMQLPENLLGK